MSYGPSGKEMLAVALICGGGLLTIGGIIGWVLRWLIYG